MDTETAWQAALGELERGMARGLFNRYVKDTHLVREAGEVVEIGVSTVEAKDWLDACLSRPAISVLRGIVNRADLEVRFVLETEPPDHPAVREEVQPEGKPVEEESVSIQESQPGTILEGEERGEEPEGRPERSENGFERKTGWTPVPDELIEQVGPLAALVGGKIWRYSQMQEHLCRASLSRLASELKLDRRTVLRAIQVLIEKGYVVDRTPSRRHQPHEYVPTEKMGLSRSPASIVPGTEASRGAARSVSRVTHRATRPSRPGSMVDRCPTREAHPHAGPSKPDSLVDLCPTGVTPMRGQCDSESLKLNQKSSLTEFKENFLNPIDNYAHEQKRPVEWVKIHNLEGTKVHHRSAPAVEGEPIPGVRQRPRAESAWYVTFSQFWGYNRQSNTCVCEGVWPSGGYAEGPSANPGRYRTMIP